MVMRGGIFFALWLLAAVAVWPQKEARKLKKILRQSARSGVMFGHEADPLYGFRWKDEQGRSDTREVCGAYPAVMGFDLHPMEREGASAAKFRRIRQEVLRQHRRGGVSVFSWHADNPLTGGNAWDVSDPNVVFRILNDRKVNARYGDWLDTLAVFFNSLQDERGRPIPVVFRPYHENHGRWFWWGETLCTEADYKALWLFTVRRLKQRGVCNLLYAYSPTVYFRDMNDYLRRYPGDAVIDVLGFDYYMDHRGKNAQEDRDIFIRQADRSFALLVPYAERHKKIVALTETGVRIDSAAHWWTKALLPVLKKYPVSYALAWRNATNYPSECWSVYPGHYLEQDFKDFYNDPYTIFCK